MNTFIHTTILTTTLRRLRAKPTVMTDIIRVTYFLFADDCALNAGLEADMQCSVDKFSDACNDFGLTISIKKTDAVHQPAPGKPDIDPSGTANGLRLNVVNRCTYLSSTLSKNVVFLQSLHQDRESQRSIWQTTRQCLEQKRH